MIKRVLKWLERRDLEQRRQQAGAHFALAVAAGDTCRADRLKAVINDLEKEAE